LEGGHILKSKKSIPLITQQAEKLAALAPKIMGAFHDLRQHQSENDQLTMRQYQALIIINAKGQLAISELCERLNLASSTGTELINRMLTAGYVEKTSESQDRRQMIIHLAVKGRNILKERFGMMTEMFEKFISPFSDQERSDFLHAFELIWQIIQNAGQKAHDRM
jgi:MarR family transcriptional regulator, organic hydroperoxide resistance regulator